MAYSRSEFCLRCVYFSIVFRIWKRIENLTGLIQIHTKNIFKKYLSGQIIISFAKRNILFWVKPYGLWVFQCYHKFRQEAGSLFKVDFLRSMLKDSAWLINNCKNSPRVIAYLHISCTFVSHGSKLWRGLDSYITTRSKFTLTMPSPEKAKL